ncbi:MAG TPA: flagellar hook-associated protein FlgK [Verrucomicrobiae bacterium]
MLGLLGTLNLAGQSMETQMTGVSVAGQNLANVNTAGYTRQTVDIETSPDIMTGIGPQGTGAEAVSIQQAVDSLLNGQIQGQQSVNGYWNAQQSGLQSVQDDLNEFLSSNTSSSSSSGGATSSGLSSLLSNVFNDFQSVATSPTSIGARQTLISDAQSLATAFNQINSGLEQESTTLNTSLSDNVDSANPLLSGIASLNQQISAAQFGGGNANDLLDERQQDLNNLAQLTDITTTNGANGAVNVSIGGQTLVSGNQVSETLQTYDPGNGNLLVQTSGGVPLTLTGGSMQGTIDARDGTLASLQSSINTLASSLITEVNSVYTTGYGLNGTTGANFFYGSDAASISVNTGLANDPSSFQAAASASTNDNTVALELANLADAPQSSLQNETFGDSFDQTVGTFGDSLQTANDQVGNQTAVTSMLTNQQSSISGVSLDQEMTNLLSFQQAYEASAELVTTVNQMLGDTLAMKSGT